MASAGRILIIVQNLPVPFDRRVWLEAITLTQEGYRVSVISPKGEGDSSYEVLQGVSLYRYAAPPEAHGTPGYVIEFAYCWLMTFYLSLKVFFREGFDVIHACNPPETFFLIGLLYKLLGRRFVFDHHDLSPEMYVAKGGRHGGFFYRGLLLLERLTFKTADVVITTNESYKAIAMERGGVREEDVFIVRSGPDFQRLKLMPPETRLKGGRQYLGCYLGEMCPQDGVDHLLYAVKHLVEDLGRRDVRFVMMGGGSALPGLRALSTELGLEEWVEFTGRVSDTDLCRYLSTADFCVDPDPWTEWSDKSTMNKVMEYMAFGKPVVAFDLKETRYSAQDAALYARPNDTLDLATKMVEILDSEERRAAMGAYGRRRIVEELAWDHTKKELLAAYRRVFSPT